MKSRINRREFLVSSIQTLGTLGVSSSAINMLLGSVYTKAFAVAAPDLKLNPDGFRYVYISLNGAPPRWMFDLLTTPNGPTDRFIAGGFGNSFEMNGTETTVVHKTFKYSSGAGKDIYLPPVWGMSPTGVDFTSLLPHTLFIRGVDMEIDSHPVSNARQVAPILGGNSIHGVIADQMGSPIAAVVNGADSGLAFKSANGLGAINPATTGNPLTAILEPFKSIKNTISYRTDNLRPVVNQFLDRIDSYATQSRLPTSSLRAAHEAADNLIRLNIDSLVNEWDGLLAKYSAVIETAMHPAKGELPGIYDKPIAPPPALTPPQPPTPNATPEALLAAKLADEIYAKNFKYAQTFRYDQNDTTKLVTISDLRDMVATSTKVQLARQFALAEFLLTTGISSTVDILAGGAVTENAQVTATLRANIPCDQHGVGVVPSVLCTTLYYRGLLSAITELVKTLKNASLFDTTIMHISSEFNRKPRADGTGADHGVAAGCTTLISGMFNEVAYIGNIKTEGIPTTNPGTWGVAAPWTFEDGSSRPIKVNDIARSITAMTNSKDVVANGYSLVQPLSPKTWVLKKSGGQNV